MFTESKQEVYTDEELIAKVGADNVDIIKEWLSKQPHLPKISGTMNALDTIRLVFAMFDVSIDEDPLAPEWKFVMDMTGFSMGHLTKLTNLSLMKKCMTYVQIALPMRLTAVHLINAPPLANQLMMFLKPLMYKHLYSMISVHPANDMDSVYKFIPKEYFASDLGGKAPSFEARKGETESNFEVYKIFFENDDKFNHVDENKRIDKDNRFNSTSYGLEGSFKKLELD
ncbi:PREDICTED: uncharacterized protein LOC107166259 [Diuraphis noxia]|uniref:uncharacterized protein LOC107166259 n=1 Tax=Diuraphis noxia TaxID=143948 RepID=UPI000763A144|nr:PREDICTED: uncharacterized protein LOC107166259 [Diuraphis noxia]